MTNSPTPNEDQAADEYDYLDTDDCWNCGGEGGYAVCTEDCCPHVYGEEGCDDPACWRRCSVCLGEGALEAHP